MNNYSLALNQLRTYLPHPLIGAFLFLVVLWSLPGIGYASEADLRGPDVVIIASEDKVVYEYRQNGILRMVRVVPNWGRPYYLVPADPTKGFGDLEKAGMLVPQWIIAEF